MKLFSSFRLTFKLNIKVTLLCLIFSSTVFARNGLDLTVEQRDFAPNEQITLSFEAYTDSYFVDSPRVHMPMINHALVKQEDPQTHSGFKIIEGKKFTVQRWKTQIYPSQDGIYTLPEIPVTLTIAGKAGKSVKVALTTKPLALLVKTPKAMIGNKDFITSQRVNISDQWQEDSKKVQKSQSTQGHSNNGNSNANVNLDLGQKAGLNQNRVLLNKKYHQGELITRDITITADNTSILTLPDFTPKSQKGIAVILSEPVVSSHYHRGNHYASITQRITYSIEKSGRYHLGGETVSWWNPVIKEKHTWQAKKVELNAGELTISTLLMDYYC
ncbi:BatD family protein [Vibrio sp. SS-MA-C1-2]|uniref:BatD family protein n=1 Tax=Vibrio sp. SS-MA-C1-2 TaxID=2908646 RepID=UPI001F443495|nr:BatD family protein [Vibrio sp. SS-MA-C1-2]UJF18069.1 BatD family protein [Vibrio sp. SS-MA-C1-2]